MYVSSRISVQTHSAKRCDVVAKMKIDMYISSRISAQANISLSKVKCSSRSHHVFTRCGHARLHTNNRLTPLVESKLS